MPEERALGGVPVPTWPQWLFAAAVVGAVWLAWSRGRGPDSDLAVPRDAEDPTATVVQHLQDVETIARTGRDGVPTLIAELENPNPRLRRNVLLSLMWIGPDAEEALGAIREQLRDTDGRIRSSAIRAYGAISRDPTDVARVVAPLLGDESPDVRQAAVKTLEAIGRPAADAVFEHLQGTNAAARLPGLNVLQQIGWAASQPEIEELIHECASAPDTAVRTEALLALARWGRLTAAETRDLLHADDQSSRDAALSAILRAGPAAVENLADVVALVVSPESNEQKNPTQRSLALAAIRSMKSAALPAVPELWRFSSELSSWLRIEIGWTLLEIGADPNEIARLAAQYLLDVNQDGDISYRSGRLCVLASPEEARSQVTRLLPHLAAESSTVKSALFAIWGMAPQAAGAVPELTSLLVSSDHEIVSVASRALGDIGPAAASAVPALRSAFKRNEPSTYRSSILLAFAKIGPAARSAVPDLIAEMKHPHPHYFHPPPVGTQRQEWKLDLSVISVLTCIGDADPEVLSTLRSLLSSEVDEVQSAAMNALVRLTPDSPDLFGDLMHRLQNSRTTNRFSIIFAIGNMTIDRQAAVLPLMRELESDALQYRKAATWALGRIGRDARAALPALRRLLAESRPTGESAPRSHGPRFEDPMRAFAVPRLWDESLLPTGSSERRQLELRPFELVVREAIAAIEPDE
jgi:HEAT repeat protein